MRLPLPGGWILRWARRAAGLDPTDAITRVRIIPQRIEVHTADRQIDVVPRGWRAILLMVLAPLVFITIDRRVRLHARIGGLPYALEALISRRRFAALAPVRVRRDPAAPSRVTMARWRSSIGPRTESSRPR